MIYIVDSAGRIVTVCAGVTDQQLAQAHGQGLTVIEDTTAEVYDRDSHVYAGGAFAPIPAPTTAELLATEASAKRLALARQAEAFIAQLTPAELAIVRAVDPSRTAERYTAVWLTWASGQNAMAQIIAAAPSASAEQISRAEGVKLAYMALAAWCARVTAGPLSAAFAQLAAAVEAEDPDAVEAVELDLSTYQIGATGDGADPDPDITQDMLWLPPADLALIAGA